MVRFVSSGGLRLATETFGKGPPLLFAHGLSGDREQSRRELAPLAARYEVVVFDQRGHGDSTPVTDPSLYAPALMADDLGRVLDDYGYGRAILGGESMGAASTLLFARDFPERVEALLLVAPAFGPDPNPERQRLEAVGRELQELGMEGFLVNSAHRLRTQFGAPEAAVALLQRMHRKHDAASLSLAFRTVSGWTIPLPDVQGKNFPSPVLVLAFAGDATHPLNLARRIAALFPNSRLETLASPFEVFTEPASVGRACLRFLEDAGRVGPDS